MSAPLRFGLVGTGGIAQAYLAAFRATAEAQLVAVADVRPEAARAFAQGTGCAVHATHEELAEAGCDAVVVCTPPATHPEICHHLIDRGVAVLCEKPLAIDAKAARGLVDAAQSAGVPFTMASKFRYVDDVIRARSILESGILGEIVLFENAFTGRVDMGSRWNSDPAVSGGGVLIDNGTHSVDLMRYFLGPIAQVQAIEGKRVQGLAVEDTARIFLRSAAGVLGSVDLSWSLDKELDSYIDIYGSEGVVRVGWRESKYRQMASPKWVVFGSGYDKVRAFTSQIENFARSIRGEETLLITAEDAIASVEVMEAVYRSLEESHWIPV